MLSNIHQFEFRNSDNDKSFEDEFVSLLTAHQSNIRQFIASLTPIIDIRNDILQEVNLVLWKKRRQFRMGTNFKAWAFSVSRYVTMNQQQRFRREGLYTFNTETLECLSQEWQQPEMDGDQRLDHLKSCLQQLDFGERKLLADCYTHRGAIEQVANHKGKSPSTIRGTLFKLRRRLHRCITHKLRQASSIK